MLDGGVCRKLTWHRLLGSTVGAEVLIILASRQWRDVRRRRPPESGRQVARAQYPPGREWPTKRKTSTSRGTDQLLEECEPDATVRIMSQENWPFENAIRGIAVRQDFAESYCDCETDRDTHDDGCPASGNYAEGLEATDVFILEGAQERYGDKAAWDAART